MLPSSGAVRHPVSLTGLWETKYGDQEPASYDLLCVVTTTTQRPTMGRN